MPSSSLPQPTCEFVECVKLFECDAITNLAPRQIVCESNVSCYQAFKNGFWAFVYTKKNRFVNELTQIIMLITIFGWLRVNSYLFFCLQFSSLDTAGYVGFANLPNQVHRKSVKKGFEFTLMIVGESGLGKSTLVNSLFLTDLYPERVVPDAIGENSCS